jgi:hypothetical protein
VWQALIGGGLIVALLTTVVTCHNERENARIAAVQTYNMSRVAAFRDSGADLDQKVAALNDAAADGRNVNDAMIATRAALASHAAKTFAMSDVFGEDKIQAYVATLKDVQKQVDDRRGRRGVGAMITAMSNMIVLRTKLADEAYRQATV